MLRPGSRGEAVRDLQVRLAGFGYELPTGDLGIYADTTANAVREFQEARGLRVDGICGPQTWSALVESGYRLGDRLLYRRRPMQRGDDVAELQRRLNGLGFDAGREDGIFGDNTTAALLEFQRNAGLALDGVCGRSVVAALDRVDGMAEGSVASVREREVMRRGPHHLSGRRVFVAAAPGFETLAHAVVHELFEAGAHTAIDVSGADDSELAAEANRFDADLFLAFRPGDRPGCRCSYFESGRFRSEAGHHIAGSLQAELAPLLGNDTCAAGRAYAVLRETRMAAVICEPVAQVDLEGMRALVARGADVARAVVRGVKRGIERPPGNVPSS